MLNTIHAIVRNGKIELLEPILLLDGVQVLVTILTEDEQTFWQAASEESLGQVWDNTEDDVYAELLTERAYSCPVSVF
ncbi:MAG: hypothetical protein M3R61_05605 [Chloroflexota bacterium]|nr:hypothetical protein [Chloroflexota bacterium]